MKLKLLFLKGIQKMSKEGAYNTPEEFSEEGGYCGSVKMKSKRADRVDSQK